MNTDVQRLSFVGHHFGLCLSPTCIRNSSVTVDICPLLFQRLLLLVSFSRDIFCNLFYSWEGQWGISATGLGLTLDQLADASALTQSRGLVPQSRLGRLYAHHCLWVIGYASQHIWCLSQARINWEGCARKGIWHKNGTVMAEMGAPISLDGVHPDCWCVCHSAPENPEDGEMYLLVTAHPGCPRQSPESCKMFVCACEWSAIKLPTGLKVASVCCV